MVEKRAEEFVAAFCEEVVEGFVGAAVLEESSEEALDGGRGGGCRALKADEAGGERVMADSPSDSETEAVVDPAVEFDFFSFEADVGKVMVGAAIAASGDIDVELVGEIGQAVFEM